MFLIEKPSRNHPWLRGNRGGKVPQFTSPVQCGFPFANFGGAACGLHGLLDYVKGWSGN
jgi:hypothetical protein